MTTDVRDTRSLPEEGFHEIQLSGKQLVFLFMATTVVCVVIFLAGVLVGRGVRTAEAAEANRADLKPASDVAAPGAGEADPPATSPAPPLAEATPAPDDAAGAADGASSTSPQAAASPSKTGGKVVEKEKAGDQTAALDYPQRLLDKQPPPEKFTAAAENASRAADPGSVTQKTTPAPAPAKATSQPLPPAPVAGGILVQVTALRQRGEAEAIARRLSQKGYQAFVVGPQAGGTPLFRVRVGPFTDQAAADATVKRLTSEEKFQPWIVR